MELLFCAQAAPAHRRPVVVHLWEDLTPTKRRCLGRLAGGTEPLHVAELATIECDPDGLSAMLASLVDAGCVEYDHASSAVRLGDLGDRDAIAEAASASFHLQAAEIVAERQNARLVCGQPRCHVAGRCVLPLGHTGRCRSKR